MGCHTAIFMFIKLFHWRELALRWFWLLACGNLSRVNISKIEHITRKLKTTKWSHARAFTSIVVFWLNYYVFMGFVRRPFLGDGFWATVCKTVRPMLSDRCLSVCLTCLSVWNVRALWPNGWTDQHETWRAGRPRPWPHCVRWGRSSPPQRRTAPTHFLAHICCGQMAAWIKMPLGMELGLSPGNFVLDGDPTSPSTFSSHVYYSYFRFR